jgi:hypothetical protein
MVADKAPRGPRARRPARRLLLAGALFAAAAFGTVTDPPTSPRSRVAVACPPPRATREVAPRLSSTALTGGLANPVISLLEDVVTFCFFLLAILLPVLVAGFVLLTVALVARRRQRVTPRPSPSVA